MLWGYGYCKGYWSIYNNYYDKYYLNTATTDFLKNRENLNIRIQTPCRDFEEVKKALENISIRELFLTLDKPNDLNDFLNSSINVHTLKICCIDEDSFINRDFKYEFKIKCEKIQIITKVSINTLIRILTLTDYFDSTIIQIPAHKSGFDVDILKKIKNLENFICEITDFLYEPEEMDNLYTKEISKRYLVRSNLKNLKFLNLDYPKDGDIMVKMIKDTKLVSIYVQGMKHVTMIDLAEIITNNKELSIINIEYKNGVRAQFVRDYGICELLKSIMKHEKLKTFILENHHIKNVITNYKKFVDYSKDINVKIVCNKINLFASGTSSLKINFLNFDLFTKETSLCFNYKSF